MPGTGAISRQTNQGNIINGPYPDAKFESGLPEKKIGAGAEISLELAGQNLKAIAEQAGQTSRGEFGSFSGPELEKLVDDTMKAIQEIGFLGPNTNLTPIARQVQLIATPFNKKADELFTNTSAEIQKVLSDDSGSTQDFMGPKLPPKQNPQGPVLAA